MEIEILEEYIRRKSPIWPTIEDRIILLNAEKLRKTNASTNGGGQHVSTSRLSNYLLLLTVIIVVIVL